MLPPTISRDNILGSPTLSRRAIGLACGLVLLMSNLLGWPLKRDIVESLSAAPDSKVTLTHGPILGRLGSDRIGIWLRTSSPHAFQIECRPRDGSEPAKARGVTRLAHDNTGWAIVRGLEPGTSYDYKVALETGGDVQESGSFRTLPDRESVRNAEHNPRGLFNFTFEFGCGNYQNPTWRSDPLMPTYQTMFRNHHREIDFQIMNGDFIYEARRGRSMAQWRMENGIPAGQEPEIVRLVPEIVGVWANYKLYLGRSPWLSRWHRHVPAYFVIDDHEMLNDIGGTGEPGHRSRETLFRDIGSRAWRDYIGWSNPFPEENRKAIRFGTTSLEAGSDVLVDPDGNFGSLDLGRISNLHVHWNDDHGAAGVYEVKEILDPTKLRISPGAAGSGEDLVYSIGRHQYYSFKVSNCEFFVLDTRSMRGLHDVTYPRKEGLSMLGSTQRAWLLEQMRQSRADFLFVVSSVNFSIPHVSPRNPDKDEAWTVFLEERERLFNFWEGLKKPVLLLTGDLHNSFAIKVTDRIWEFASAPHNSGNHYLGHEGHRPPSGPFEYNGREVDIRWSSFFLNDVPREHARRTYYCIVQINNVVNNPTADDDPRWVAFPRPQAVIRFYDGLTGELEYAQAVAATP